MIHVCSLAALPETVKATGASHVLTVMANVDQVQRPESVLEANHLKVRSMTSPNRWRVLSRRAKSHIEQVLNFVRGWDRHAPLVVHCYAGISRSTASAFAAACMLNPHRDEISIARQIRAASPIASPNRLIVSLADKALRTRGPDAARARRDGSGQSCWSKAGRSASISTDVNVISDPGFVLGSRGRDGLRIRMSEKPLTPIEIGLTAAIVAIEGNEPLILTASGSDGDKLAGSAVRPVRRGARTAPSRSACAPGWKSRRACGSAMSNSSTPSAIAAGIPRPATPTRMSPRSAISR